MGESARASFGGEMANGGFQRASLNPASQKVVPIVPSGPTQNTSRWSGVRATAVMGESARAAFGGEMANGGFQRALLNPASQKVVPIVPSGPTQNTSRWSGVRATTAMGESARASFGGEMANGGFQRA